MKSLFVNDLKPNQDATTVLLVQNKTVRQKKTGEPYLSLALGDKTGAIDAKMWDGVPEVMDTFERDDFVKVKGRVLVYQNRPQLTIHRMTRIDPAEVALADFFPASERDPDEMMAELRGFASGIGNQHLKALVMAVLDDKEIADKYKRAPAAKSVHHAYLGGLIEHVLSLCHLSDKMAAHYPFVDRDLLITASILHDLGKIEELAYERSFSYTDGGQLLGHITIGLRMIDDKLRGLPDFPPRLRTLVEHMVLSHHGELAFGSPKVPMFTEALLFHLLDSIDSKMENIRGTIARDQQLAGFWTAYNPPLERALLKTGEFLNPPETQNQPASPGNGGRKNGGQGSLFGEKLNQALGGDD